eukprot:PhM_4_TR3418/c1_g2_i11/m.82495
MSDCCGYSREQLETYLRESDYGTNTAAFECYFQRRHAGSTSPPLCSTCGLGIGRHPPSGPIGAAVVVGQPAIALGAAVAVVATSPPALPDKLIRGDTEDYVETGYNKCVACTYTIMFVVGFVATMVLVSMKYYFVIASPCVLTLIGLLMLFLVYKRRVAFDKHDKVIRCTTTRLPFHFLCSSVAEVPFADLTGEVGTETRTSKHNSWYEVVARVRPTSVHYAQLRDNGGFVLSTCRSEADVETAKWTAYLSQLLYA